MENDYEKFSITGGSQPELQRFVDARKRYLVEQDYLDRVALEAMKQLIPEMAWVGKDNGPQISLVVKTAHEIARAMLKERSREQSE